MNSGATGKYLGLKCANTLAMPVRDTKFNVKQELVLNKIMSKL